MVRRKSVILREITDVQRGKNDLPPVQRDIDKLKPSVLSSLLTPNQRSVSVAQLSCLLTVIMPHD